MSTVPKKLTFNLEKNDKVLAPHSILHSVHPDHRSCTNRFARASAQPWHWLALALACACSSEPERAGVQPIGVGGTTAADAVTTSEGASTTTATSVGGNGAVSSSAVTTSSVVTSSSVTSSAVSSAGGTASTTGGLGTTSSGGAGTLGSSGTSSSDDTSSGSIASGAGGSSGGGTMGATGTTGGPIGPTTVWIAGDSTVANGNTPCPAGWGKHFAPYFDDQVTIRNSAVGGRSVRTWLYNVTTEMDSTGECVLMTDGNGEPTLQARWQEMLDGMQPGDTLLIQFGINDGSATCDRHVGLQAFKDSYAMMAEAAVSRGAQPVFVTPVSAIACNGTTARGTRGGYVDATFEAGAENGVPVIDLHQLSVDLYNELGFCPIPGGDVSASTTGPVGDFFCDDHTHFSDAGAIEIAGLVAAGLKDTGVALTQHLLE